MRMTWKEIVKAYPKQYVALADVYPDIYMLESAVVVHSESTLVFVGRFSYILFHQCGFSSSAQAIQYQNFSLKALISFDKIDNFSKCVSFCRIRICN